MIDQFHCFPSKYWLDTYVCCFWTDLREFTETTIIITRHFYIIWKGGRLFQPAPSEQFEGHFHSFMDADFIHRSISPQVQNIDAEQPSRKEKNLGICKNSSCRQFSFLSEADSKRHYRLAHGGKRGNDIGDTGVKRQFKCGVCNIYHLTQYRLRKHIEETGHKGVMGRPKNNK